jgi:hypothetical protein
MKLLLLSIALLLTTSTIQADDEYALVNIKKLRDKLEQFDKRMRALESVVYYNKVVFPPKDIKASEEVLTGDMMLEINSDSNLKDLINKLNKKEER